MKKLLFTLIFLSFQILSDEDEYADPAYAINKKTVAGQYNPAYAIASKGKYSPYQSSYWP